MLENKKNLTFLAGVQVKEEIYFSAWNTNGLFKMDPKTGKCTFLTRFTGEGEQFIHSSAVYYKEAIWFIPSWSNRITRVDIHTLEMSYIMLPDHGIDVIFSNKTRPSIRLKVCYEEGESNLYLTPYAYNLVLKVDLDKKELVICSEWETGIFSDSLRVENEIWLCPSHTGQVVAFDTISQKEKTFFFDSSNAVYLNIGKYHEQILFFPHKLESGIVIVDCYTQDKKRLYFEGKNQNYQTLCMSDGYAFLPPYQGNECVLVDFEKNQCSVALRLPEERFMLSKGFGYYLSCMKYNDEWWFLSNCTGNPILRYNPTDNSGSFLDIWIEKRLYERDLVKYLSANRNELYFIYPEMVFEEKEHSYEFFIDLLKMKSDKQKRTRNTIIGEQIYTVLKKSM